MTKEELVKKFSALSDMELLKEFFNVDQKISLMMVMDIGELIEKKEVLEGLLTNKGLMEDGKIK